MYLVNEDENKVLPLFGGVGFHKISENQYKKDSMNQYIEYSDIKIPRRATLASAGYDLFSVTDFVLAPGGTIELPTGIRVVMPQGYFAMIVPRSGLGFKYGIRLTNTVGIIDADYSNSDNEGHIWIKLEYPYTNEQKDNFIIKQGDAIAQIIILPFAGFVTEIKPTKTRNGGRGSTDK